MGLRHSKPKTQRNSKRFKRGTSGRRQSPEGGNQSPVLAPGSKSEDSKSALCTGACPCSGTRGNDEIKSRNLHSNKENHSPPSIGHDKEELFTPPSCYAKEEESLKVDLPPQEDVTIHSVMSRGRPSQRSVSHIKSEEESSEWSFTIPQVDLRSCDGEERISLLMSSIREEVVTRLDELHSKKNGDVRLRLSLTPEPRALMASQRDDSLVARALETRRNYCKSKSEGTTPVRYRACSRDENHDRRRYYRQIPGNDSEKDLLKKASLHSGAGGCGRDAGTSKSRSRSRDAHSKSHFCSGGARCRHNHSSDRNLQACSGGRHQSAYDQSFQETMVLRLRELQRNTEKLARRANGDDLDDDIAVSSSSGSTSESEYSGADDGAVRPHGDPGVSRLYQPISDRDVEALGLHDTDPHVEQSVMFRHNQTCSMRSSAGRVIESTSVVHRSESTTKEKTKNRKRRKKRLKSELPMSVTSVNASNHGYLRANAIKSGAICSLPTSTSNTRSLMAAKSLTAGDTAPSITTKSSVIRHQHEHIHHHYYYPCKPDT